MYGQTASGALKGGMFFSCSKVVFPEGFYDFSLRLFRGCRVDIPHLGQCGGGDAPPLPDAGLPCVAGGRAGGGFSVDAGGPIPISGLTVTRPPHPLIPIPIRHPHPHPTSCRCVRCAPLPPGAHSSCIPLFFPFFFRFPRYLEAISPLCSAAEFDAAKQNAQAFLVGDGAKLQTILEVRQL